VPLSHVLEPYAPAGSSWDCWLLYMWLTAGHCAALLAWPPVWSGAVGLRVGTLFWVCTWGALEVCEPFGITIRLPALSSGTLAALKGFQVK
jgi:hypothetical protein